MISEFFNNSAEPVGISYITINLSCAIKRAFVIVGLKILMPVINTTTGLSLI